jgi:hypothetical protein
MLWKLSQDLLSESEIILEKKFEGIRNSYPLGLEIVALRMLFDSWKHKLFFTSSPALIS